MPRSLLASLFLCLVPCLATNVAASPDDAEVLVPPTPSPATMEGSYDPAGRRDPFAGPGLPEVPVGSGIAAMQIGDLDLQGIVVTPDGAEKYALVLAPDGKGYSLETGDVLLDGKVEAIERDRVRFLRRNTDPIDPRPFLPAVIRLDPEER